MRLVKMLNQPSWVGGPGAGLPDQHRGAEIGEARYLQNDEGDKMQAAGFTGTRTTDYGRRRIGLHSLFSRIPQPPALIQVGPGAYVRAQPPNFSLSAARHWYQSDPRACAAPSDPRHARRQRRRSGSRGPGLSPPASTDDRFWPGKRPQHLCHRCPPPGPIRRPIRRPR